MHCLFALALRRRAVMAVIPVSLWTAIVMMAFWDLPSASQAANHAAIQVEPSVALVGKLAKSIDATKSKPNDPVTVLLTMDVIAHGRIVISRGARIVGHVSVATSRSRGLPGPGCHIENAFDRIVLKKGLELPVQATIRAIGAPLRSAFPNSEAASDVDLPSPASTQPAPGPNERRAINSTTFPGSRGPAVADGPSEEAATPGRAVGPLLGPASEGVVGIRGIELTSTAQGSSVISTRKNLHLSGGTQLVLCVLEPQLLLDSLQKSRDVTGLQPRK